MKAASAFSVISTAILSAAGLTIPPLPYNVTCGPASGLTVQIPGGKIHGTVDQSTPCVRRFLGIPYAKPPVGKLRFAPPQPAGPFGELSAKQLGPSCMHTLMKKPPTIYTQLINEFNLQGLNETSPFVSEDCLSLGVWAPVGQNATARPLPVIMFIHGGGFAMGGQDVPYQIPAKWVQRAQDLVIVTFNYRLNIFGFPNAAGISLEKQNLGLLDQRLAVEWVRDNIAAFGGDPQRITLWGQSAGAVSAGFYQYAYASDPIVWGIIMDSGSETLGSAVVSTTDTNHTQFTTIAEKLGCGGRGPEQELECMRSANVSAGTVEQAIQTHSEATPSFFTPVVDGVTVFANYSARPAAQTPTIIGTNVDDGVAFAPLGPDGMNETLADAATLALFFCPALKSATNRIAAGVPVYRYLYDGDFPNISPVPFLGSYHEAELPLLFGTDQDFRGPSTPLERAIGRAMQDAWRALASGGVKGMAETGWPLCTDATNCLVREFGVGGAKQGSVAQDISTAKMAESCPVP